MRIILSLLMALMASASLAASDALEGTTQARVIRDFARLSFEWSRPVYLSANSANNTITIEFERPVQVDSQAAVKALGPYVASARLEQGGKRMVLTTRSNYRVRSFVTEQVSGIDILDVKSSPSKAVASKAPQKQEQAKQVATTAKPKPSPAASGNPASLQAKLNNLSPAARAPVAAPIAAAATEAQAPASASAPVAAESPPAAPATQVAAAPVEQAPVAQAAPAPVAAAEPAPVTPAGDLFKIDAQVTGDSVNIHFPWKERVAAAAFKRGTTLWLVFSKATVLDIHDANLILQPGASIKQLDVQGATVLQIDTRPDAGMQLATTEGSFDWQVTITSPAPQTLQPLAVNTLVPEGLPAHAIVPVLEAPSTPVTITDPAIGDTLIVMPVYAAGKGVFPERSFVDFNVLPSAQGVVVQPHADDVSLSLVLNGVRIDAGGGAHISSDLPPVAAGENVQVKMDTTQLLYPYDAWKPQKPELLDSEINALMLAIAKDRNATGVVNKYLRAAQIYLSQGLAPEALGMVGMVKRLDPEFFVEKRVSALEAAASFLMNRQSDAFQAISVPELDGHPEVLMWRSLIGELLGTPSQTFDYLAHYDDWISKYPPLLRQRLAILAADRAVATKEYNAALKIFDQLNQEKMIDEVADYVNYLMATISVESGQVGDGFKIWTDLVEQSGREFVKARASYALTSQRYSRGMITPAEAAEELEKLSLRWRGDGLDLSVLTLLSSIYSQQKDWPNALRIWRSMNEGFPNTVEAVNAMRQMDEAFNALFAKGEVGSLSTLDQLFLFHEYRNLLQDNDAGDVIADRVIGKMLALDMLPQAADLLEKRMKVRLEREARSKAGAQLARIYLMSKQPDKALTALQDSGFGQNPDALDVERNRLAVEAMIELKRYDDAMRFLAEDESVEAQGLRAEVYWRKKEWDKLTPELEAYFKEKVKPASTLTASDTNYLVYLALGYQALGEYEQLSYLRDYFTPLLGEGASSQLIEFLTRQLPPVTPSTFDDAMDGVEAMRSFLTSYRISKTATHS